MAMAKRFELMRRSQEANESIMDYAAALESLGLECQYPNKERLDAVLCATFTINFSNKGDDVTVEAIKEVPAGACPRFRLLVDAALKVYAARYERGPSSNPQSINININNNDDDINIDEADFV